MRTDAYYKIVKKGSPKDYKTGTPGPTGRDRLQRRVYGLLLAAGRLSTKTTDGDERAWANALVSALQAFVNRDRDGGQP